MGHILTKRTAGLILASTVVLVSWGSAPGAPLWFDETGGGGGYATFGNLVQAYNAFMGAPGQTITFNNLAEGALPTTQYPGVSFGNLSAGPYASSSGAHAEAGSIVQDLTGYDGSYMPNGDMVLVKFGNDAASTPLTINFASPVTEVGAFIGTGIEGSVHSFTISAYDAAGQLLGTHAEQSWLWESDPYWQNYESFFGVRSPEGLISKVTIRNDSPVDFADALILDNVSYSGGTVVAEPAALLLFGGAGLVLMGARRGRSVFRVSAA